MSKWPKLRQKLAEAKPPEAVMKQAERELKRLDFVPQAARLLGHRDLQRDIAELPWSKMSEDNLDLDKAQEILIAITTILKK